MRFMSVIMVLSVCVPLGAFGQSGIAEGYCNVGQNILLRQTFPFRQRGVPIEIAQSSVESFLSSSPRFWHFMNGSIVELYGDPDSMQVAITTGRWMTACIKEVRGF